MSLDVSILDYGMGNILSIIRALRRVGANVHVIQSQSDFKHVKRLIIPGVGSYFDAMCELQNRSYIDYIYEHVNLNKPLLGICLGMQLLFSRGEEVKLTNGLDLIQGDVVYLTNNAQRDTRHKVPHVGWSKILLEKKGGGSLLGDINGSDFYFVHSYKAVPKHDRHIHAKCNYNGIDICALVQRELIIGCQFHPEKSGEKGLAILKEFIQL